MPFHQGSYSGTVAVSYSTSPMAPLSPSISRRYSGTVGGSTTSSRISSSTSKYNTYRPSSTTSSILDRTTYSKPLGTSRINYLSGRSICSPARWDWGWLYKQKPKKKFTPSKSNSTLLMASQFFSSSIFFSFFIMQSNCRLIKSRLLETFCFLFFLFFNFIHFIHFIYCIFFIYFTKRTLFFSCFIFLTI